MPVHNEGTTAAPTGVAHASPSSAVYPPRQCYNAQCNSRARVPVDLSPIDKYVAWEQDRPWRCQVCGFHLCAICKTGYKTLAGLSVHLRRKHPSKYHDTEVEREQVKARWSWGEVIKLAGEELRLTREKLKGNLNVELQKLFPLRTVEAIKSFRKRDNARYREALEEERLRFEELTNGVPGSVSRPELDNSCLLENIREMIVLQSILGRPPQEGDKVENSQQFLDRTLESTFPSKRPPAIRSAVTPDMPTRNTLRRRKAFRNAQELLRRNPGRLLDSILDGSLGNPPVAIPPGSESFWTDLLSRPSPVGAPAYDPLPNHLDELLRPILEDEVISILKSKGKGAPGPDGWTWNLLKKQSNVTKTLASLFNLWLYCGSVPERICQATTTLIPKKPGTTDPAEFRPISVGSIFLRLYHGVLGARFEQSLPISARQKGFRKGDGIFFNVVLLKKCLEQAKTKCQNLRVAFLDMKKAFDSVGHDALWAACHRLGVPKHLIDYCSRFYKMSGTRILLGHGKLSDRIVSRRGIKQGDPLSVHLFNAVIDLCVSRMNPNIGFPLEAREGSSTNRNADTITYLAFADDLVLLAPSQEGLEVNCQLLMKDLAAAGFEANASKSATLSIVARKGKWLCDGSPFLSLGGNRVPAIGICDTYKYLGVPIGAAGPTESTSAVSPARLLAGWLEAVTKAPLKPQQRIFLLRVFLLPKLYHRLVLEKNSAKRLTHLDFIARREVKRWMKMRSQVPTAFFYASDKDGGLAIPSLRTLIPRLRHQRLCRMTSYDDPLAHHVFELADLPAPEVSGIPVGTRESGNLFWRGRLAKLVDGKGLLFHSEVPQAHRWTREPTSLLTGRDFIRVNSLRYNLLITRQLQHRMNKEVDINCPVCINVPHTLGHILQTCPRSHGPRVHRHNMIAEFLRERLKRKQWKVAWEPHVPTRSGLLKPDLMFWHDDHEVAYVLDVAIVADNVDPFVPYRAKTSKYSNPEVSAFLRELSGKQLVEVGAMVVNWRGAICRQSVEFCRKWLLRRDYAVVSLRVLQYGVYSYDFWNRSAVIIQTAMEDEPPDHEATRPDSIGPM